MIDQIEPIEPLQRRSRAPVRISVAAFLLFLGSTTVGVVLALLNGGTPSLDSALLLVAFAAFMAVGALVVARRPENALGWVYAAAGLLAGTGFLAMEYAQYAYVTRPGGLPGAVWAAWYAAWYWYPLLSLMLFFTPFLFPTGTPLSPRWRWLLWVTAVVTAGITVQAALIPVLELQDVDFRVPNPIGVSAVGNVEQSTAGSVLFVVLLACLLAGLASLVIRFRRSRGEERLQLKWFCYAALLLVLVPIEQFLPIDRGFVGQVSDFVFGLTIVLLPVATGIAILKYRLYDIDVVINKTLVYGALAAFITAVYVAIVVGIGSLVGREGHPNLALSITATAVVALAFQPVRTRVQHLANRLVYGHRATPYEVLSDLARRMGAADSAEDLLPRMARTLGEGTGVAAATVWLRVDAELRPAAAWPESVLSELAPIAVTGHLLPPLPGADAAAPIVLDGDLLGALSVRKAAGERVPPAESRLLTDLASQAGLVLRNVRLTEELRARMQEIERSRQRILAARDDERRRLERSIDGGARRRLEALTDRVAGARASFAPQPEEALRLIAEAADEGARALDDLREVARGLYPPLLADQGLVAALSAHARRSPLEVDIRGYDIGRYPEDVESALYFCVVEALRGAADRGGARRVEVRIADDDGALTFAVVEEGAAEAEAAPDGDDLLGMSDRLAALGGTLRVEPTPGGGTTVTGWLPARAREAVS